MFRPNLAFLDDIQLRFQYEREVESIQSKANPNWDPHMTLEFFKVVLRSVVSEYSLKYREVIEDKVKNLSSRLDQLQDIKTRVLDIEYKGLMLKQISMT